MPKYEQPPELTDEQVRPFLDLLRVSGPEEFENLAAVPGLREHYADKMARAVWGYAYRACWDGIAFRPLMSGVERRLLAEQCRSSAEALRVAMTSGLIDRRLAAYPFFTNALDRLPDLQGDYEHMPHYLTMSECEERSFIVGTAIARECLARQTETAVWPRVERRYLVQPSHAERAQQLADEADRLACELEGRAILLEAIAQVLPPAKGSQDTGARYMFATCISAYRNALKAWPSSYPESCPPLYGCVDGLLRFARGYGRKRPRGASSDTFLATLQALRHDDGSYEGFQQLDVRGRIANSIVDTPPAKPEGDEY